MRSVTTGAVVALAIGVLVTAGCSTGGEACSVDESECQGNVLWTCTAEEGLPNDEVLEQDCAEVGGTCMEFDIWAACVADTTTVCVAGETRCTPDGTGIQACLSSFERFEAEGNDCEDGATCVEVDGAASCVVPVATP